MSRSARWFPVALTAALALVLTFLALPVVAVFANVGPGRLAASLAEPGVLDALRLSLLCSLAAVALIVSAGTPAAYLLATRRFRGREALITSPSCRSSSRRRPGSACWPRSGRTGSSATRSPPRARGWCSRPAG